MESKDSIHKPEDDLDVLDLDAADSVDDFIKELEEKEKDLHITADLTIEIEESEYDPRNIPDDLPVDFGSISQKIPTPVSTVSSEATAAAKARIQELEEEVESLKKRLSVLREERNDVQEKSDRRLKDFESYKYRMDRERRGSFIDQISNLATQMLPVFDNLDRALMSVGDPSNRQRGDFDQFYDGIVLVNQQVAEVFADMGVEPISSVGKEFDPHFHEAVAVADDPNITPNTIVEEMLRGYRIGNRVIRHSMVKVVAGAAPVKAVEEALTENEIFDEQTTSETNVEPVADFGDIDAALADLLPENE